MSLIPSESYSFPDHLRHTRGTIGDSQPPVFPDALFAESRRSRTPRNAIDTQSLSILGDTDNGAGNRSRMMREPITIMDPGAIHSILEREMNRQKSPTVYGAPVSSAVAHAAEISPGQSDAVSPRRAKLLRFIAFELLAIGALAGSASLVSSRRFADPAILSMLNVTTLVAAAAVALIPIVMFAFAPTLPGRAR